MCSLSTVSNKKQVLEHMQCDPLYAKLHRLIIGFIWKIYAKRWSLTYLDSPASGRQGFGYRKFIWEVMFIYLFGRSLLIWKRKSRE